jgi:hypothetical protein
MTTHLVDTVANNQRDNDYFTATVVGLPIEVALGRSYTERKLKQHPTITVNATTAAIWHSDAAHVLLKERIKQSPKTLGLPFLAGNSTRRRSEKSSLLPFLLGFGLCAALCYAYVTQPWLQQLLIFSIST